MPTAHSIISSQLADGDWAYVCEQSKLDSDRPLLPVELDTQPYILFRDDNGELGMIGRHCPHRGADLCFGRLEDNGIRCPFHGWHFDRSGQCTEQPAEPEGSNMARAIAVPMVPLREVDGKIFAWVGDGQPGVDGRPNK